MSARLHLWRKNGQWKCRHKGILLTNQKVAEGFTPLAAWIIWHIDNGIYLPASGEYR